MAAIAAMAALTGLRTWRSVILGFGHTCAHLQR